MRAVRTVGMALTGAAIAVVTAVPAQADAAEKWAFLYADQPTEASYEPEYWSASEGVDVEVNRESEGSYTVELDEGGADDGVPMVTAVNEDHVHCQVAEYSRDDDDEDIAVNCYQGTVLTDSAFSLSFFSSSGHDGLDGAYGYVRNDRPTAPVYTTPPSYNSTGQDVMINLDTATDVWTVHFLGREFANDGGNVQVTALGTKPARCSVVGWNKTSVGVDARVRCDDMGGVTPQWILAYTHQRSIVGNRDDYFGYLQADDPTSPSYKPNPDRNLGPNDFAHKVTRSNVGRYEVQVHGPVEEPIGVHITVNGDTDRFCVLTGAEVLPPPVDPAEQPSALVQIACYTADGEPADSWYSLNYYAP